MERTVSNDGPEFSKLTASEYKKDVDSIWRELNRIAAILEGPPFPGLEDYVNTFITEFKAVEKERHTENQQKLADISRKMGQRSFWIGIAGVSISLMALVVTIVGIMVGIWIHTHANVDLPKLFQDGGAPSVSLQQLPQNVNLPASFSLR
jgi:hypothetical protein